MGTGDEVYGNTPTTTTAWAACQKDLRVCCLPIYNLRWRFCHGSVIIPMTLRPPAAGKVRHVVPAAVATGAGTVPGAGGRMPAGAGMLRCGSMGS